MERLHHLELSNTSAMLAVDALLLVACVVSFVTTMAHGSPVMSAVVGYLTQSSNCACFSINCSELLL